MKPLSVAVLERLATEPHARLRYFCSPQHTDSALYSIIGQMERAAGLAHDDKPQAKLDKLDAVLAQTSTSAQDAALFAETLSLPNDGRYPALETSMSVVGGGLKHNAASSGPDCVRKASVVSARAGLVAMGQLRSSMPLGSEAGH